MTIPLKAGRGLTPGLLYIGDKYTDGRLRMKSSRRGAKPNPVKSRPTMFRCKLWWRSERFVECLAGKLNMHAGYSGSTLGGGWYVFPSTAEIG